MDIHFDHCSTLRARFDLFRRTLNCTPTDINCNQTIAHGVYEKEKTLSEMETKRNWKPGQRRSVACKYLSLKFDVLCLDRGEAAVI